MLLAVFFDVTVSSVRVQDCNFTNGRAPKSQHLSNRGGGIAVITSLSRPLGVATEQSVANGSTPRVSIEVTDSLFYNNTAYSAGGAYSLFLPFPLGECADTAEIRYHNCNFSRNKAVFGAAMIAEEHNVITVGLVSNPPHRYLIHHIRS